MEALSLLNPHLNIVSNIFSSLNTENGKMFKAIVVKYSSLKRCRKSATAYSSVILLQAISSLAVTNLNETPATTNGYSLLGNFILLKM